MAATYALHTENLQETSLLFLKRGIWLYFFLLIFEGALRKWFLPGLADPLLLIRDPLAIFLLFQSVQKNLWHPGIFEKIMWGLTILALITTLLIGHGNLTVAAFGLRITLIHFPLIFLIGTLFNKGDVIEIGKILLWINIAMTVLVAIQFYSPQSAWVNLGIGGNLEGSGFSGAAGFYRVPGTFSFTNGLALFYGLAAAFIFYFWLEEEKKQVSKILLIVSTLALLSAIPLSVSRTVLFQIMLTFIFMVKISGNNIRILPKIGIVVLAIGLMFTIMKDISFFQTASTVFTERFTVANKVEGGMEGVFVDRFLGGMYSAITDESFSFWGMGLGMGTNAGTKLLTGTNDIYLISEGEWGRLVGEMGVIIGFSVILIRISLVLHLLKKAWGTIGNGNVLPWMLLSFGMILILQGQWSQPTNLGFSVLTGGLIIASLKNNEG
ncbi:hypothetical protein FHG64_00480 [Antarcticibacterium flavum]|uniref:O-antigen ligase family protein n=1 Tax=Antarcticibacterium flavum TaxID=2058175 RepID=A0A5B7X053_9FLAO|nr:hypothetical protein [Antarcticibacterium sp. W02-3]QCY67991.1 hypothetical protein FHG64_00480 [Antarcticibacterium flavum]